MNFETAYDADSMVRSAIDQAPLIELASGARVFNSGDMCRGLPLVLSGEIRLHQTYPNGRDLELYRVGPGDMCVLSVAALIGTEPHYQAYGVASAATELRLLSTSTFLRLLGEDEQFRRHVLGDFSTRMFALLKLVDDLVERRLDQRLAALLVRRGPLIEHSHVQLADELGTVREMVSRLLARFDRAGWVELGRLRIKVRDTAALHAFAQTPA